MGHLERRTLPGPVVGRGEGAADRLKNGDCKSPTDCVKTPNRHAFSCAETSLDQS